MDELRKALNLSKLPWRNRRQVCENKISNELGIYVLQLKENIQHLLMAVANSEYEFIMTDIGANGRVCDGGIYSHTTFGQMFKSQLLHLPEPACLLSSDRQVPYVLIGVLFLLCLKTC